MKLLRHGEADRARPGLLDAAGRVGGITPEIMADFVSSGASGFGLGSQLYQPGFSLSDVAARARVFVETWRALLSAKGKA